MNWLKLFLDSPIKELLPNWIRVWHIPLITAVFVSVLYFRNPGGRNFDDNLPAKPPLSYPDIDNPKNILRELQADFNSNASHLTPVLLHLARACDGAYANGETTIPRLFFDTKFDLVVPIGSGPNAAIIGLKGNLAVVVFRGTDEIKDWYTNLNARWISVEHGKFHFGFWAAYKSLREEIVKTLSSRDLKHLWICGHSLGGAMALCCAYDFANTRTYPLSGIVTFGQPKLTDGRLASHLNKTLKGKYLAIVADEDPVADTVPLCHFCGNAVWFNGTKIFFDKGQVEAIKDDLQEKDGVPSFRKVMTEDKLRQKREKLKMEERLLPRNFDDPQIYGSSLPFFRDHNMSNYIGKLRTYFALTDNDKGR